MASRHTGLSDWTLQVPYALHPIVRPPQINRIHTRLQGVEECTAVALFKTDTPRTSQSDRLIGVSVL